MATLIDLRQKDPQREKHDADHQSLEKWLSASKLRRRQERMMASRPYSAKMIQVANSLAIPRQPGEPPASPDQRGHQRGTHGD